MLQKQTDMTGGAGHSRHTDELGPADDGNGGIGGKGLVMNQLRADDMKLVRLVEVVL
jgi:hypothetical protein